MADIFISYARADRERVEPIAKALEAQGWSVWWDRNILAGNQFDEVIETELTAAKCVLVLWSHLSIRSSWVKEEADVGKERQILVPAKIDEVKPPLGFRFIHAADLTDLKEESTHPGWATLFNSINQIVEPLEKGDRSGQTVEIVNLTIEKKNENQSGPTLPPESISPQSDATSAAPETAKPELKRTQNRYNLIVFSLLAIVVLITGVWFIRIFVIGNAEETRTEVTDELERVAAKMQKPDEKKPVDPKTVKPDRVTDLSNSQQQLQNVYSNEESTAKPNKNKPEELTTPGSGVLESDELKQQERVITSNLKSDAIPSTSYESRNGIVNSLGMEFVYVPPGKFTMGSPVDEPGRDNNEIQHEVTLTQGFYLQTTEVTQKQWRKVMENNRLFLPDCDNCDCEDCPVQSVSWNDVQYFIEKLNDGDNRYYYRLPTEAEWEYACRAGTTTRYSWGDEPDCKKANYGNGFYRGGGYSSECKDINPGKPSPVGRYPANPWGLYDMNGNVWEWCADWWEEYSVKGVTDPTGAPSQRSSRVIRGGSYNDPSENCRAADRSWYPTKEYTNEIGFRLVRIPGQLKGKYSLLPLPNNFKGW